MAGRGTKSRPNRLKILHGERDARRLNDDEPVVPKGMPEMPVDLDPVAELEWLRVCEIMVENGTITRLDRVGLVAYCEWVSDKARYREEMEDRGEWQTNPNTGVMTTAPWVLAYRDADTRVRMWANELGLTPCSRSRVVSNKPKAGGIKARSRA